MTDSSTFTSEVAVVGMACHVPGARDLGEYWENLRTGQCAIADFSAAELAAAGVDEDQWGSPHYVPAKGFLPDADRFEAELFGFSASQAAALDPQHRLLLQAAWAALEDAGYHPRHAPGRTGVYVGGGLSEHMLAAMSDPELATALGPMQVRILTDRDFLAPWVSYRLGLTGPSITVQTACSTSLTAVHLAAQALQLGECDTALAGGVSVNAVHKHGYLHRDGDILSPDGRCRPFDEKAAGTVPGNGTGVVVLRRLADALAGGDPVRAVVRGTAATNDGAARLGFTAPGVDQQSAAIVEAWAAAGLTPSAAQYLETHGTGTELGDRVEVAAMRAAFDGRGECDIGSVKSNLGHLDAAAGVAALIKTVLMLEHRMLVPTVNVARPHPDLGLGDAPFRLVTSTAQWPVPAGAGPRLAGVTSLGIGGTNVHIVLAEAPCPLRRVDPPPRAELLPLSAGTTGQLATIARNLAGALRAPGAPPLRDVAHTLRTGRAALGVRACLPASTREQAAARLEALAARLEAFAARPEALAAGPGVRDEELPPLAQAWLRGEDVTWPKAADRAARRVHLPTYPFAGDRYGALRSSRAATVADAPASGIADLLVRTLELDGPGALDQTYLAAGGDSLMAVHLVGRLRDDFGIEVPIELLLEPITLRELIDRLTTPATRDNPLASLLDEFESE